MSNTPTHTKDSASPRERRLYIRQPVSSLAYLDIDADNGGIAVNLSEAGMAFQAVCPLERQARVSLRIQVPHSQERIDTAAQVVWLSESRRHVGVRFVDMPSGARARLQEWLRSETPLGTRSEDVVEQPEIVSGPPRKQREDEEAQAAGANRWRDALAQHPAFQPEGEVLPPTSNSPEQRRSAPIEQETAEKPTAQTLASMRPAEHAPSAHATVDQPPENAKLAQEARSYGPDGGSPAPEFPDRTEEGGQIFLRWPISSSLIEPSKAVEPTDPPLTLAEPTPWDIDSEADPTPLISDAVAPPPAALRRNQARKWGGIAGIFALFSILSFSLGTWIGFARKHVPSGPSAKEPTVSVPVHGSNTNAMKKHKAIEVRSAISRTARAEHTMNNSAGSNHQQTPLPTSSPLVLPLERNVPPTPITQQLTPPTGAKPPETNSARAPLPEDSAPAPPAPNMVAGRTLKPTDRFNPCHLSYRVEPTYPEAARQQRIEGAVKIHLVIGADGNVLSMKLLSGSPLLAPAAMEAARYWRYLPALLNGEPVETQQDIEIDFHLPRS
jgi:TonB family protein